MVQQRFKLKTGSQYLLLIAAATYCTSVCAETSAVLSENAERFHLRAAFYEVHAKTRLRADGAGGNVGTVIDMEDDLNLPGQKSSTFLGARFVIKPRHILELENYDLSREGLQTLRSDIQFGDQVFSIGGIVRTYMDVEVTRLGYAYTLIERPNWAVALSGGVHVTKIDTGLVDVAAVQPLGSDNVARAGATAPLPVIGLSGVLKISEKWVAVGRTQIFRLTIDDVSGQLNHLSLSIENKTFEHFGFGIGWDFFDINTSMEKRAWNGDVNFQFRGPMFFLSGYF